MTSITQNQEIKRTKVAIRSRMRVMPKYLPGLYMQFENQLYNAMEKLTDAYEGGYWEMYELANGAFYMAPTCAKKYQISVAGNYFEGEMTADAAGIVATLMAVNALAWSSRKDFVSTCIMLCAIMRLNMPKRV